MSNSIRFLHLRDYEGFEGPLNRDVDGPNLCLKGGKTIAYRVNENHTMDYVVAKCGNKENYNRKRGRMIAGGRLLCDRAATQTKYLKTVDLTEHDSDATPVEVLVELEG